MFNEVTFREILLSSLGKVKIMSRIFKENIQTWTETIELSELDEKKLHNATN